MEAAPSCVFLKMARFSAAADLVLLSLEMPRTVKVRKHAHAHTHTCTGTMKRIYQTGCKIPFLEYATI